MGGQMLTSATPFAPYGWPGLGTSTTTVSMFGRSEAIGPPVSPRFAAISLIDSGGKSPTLLLAGLAQPSSQTTPSGSTFHVLAARAHNSTMTFLVASTTAMPVAKVTREPPVTWV